MNFSDYLFFTKRLTPEECVTLAIMQNKTFLDAYNAAPASFSPNHLSAVTNLAEVRRTPFGEVLTREGSTTFARIMAAEPGKNLETLVTEWQQWHVENLEPISTYSLGTKIGEQMFKLQTEKKLVARHVAGQLVQDDDIVCIAEGSSAMYVGMAIGLLRQNVTIVTSNDPLLREFRENPQLVGRFKEMEAIGGHVDDHITHGGVSGDKCQEQFAVAIARKPGATVVIMPVTGFLPDEGPFGLDPATRGVKEQMITASLAANVRALIFITVHAKHLQSKKATYGEVVFNGEGKWLDLLNAHRDRIQIVTAPPPELRRRMVSGVLGQPRRRKALDKPYVLPQEEIEYDVAAERLARLLRKGMGLGTNFYEVCK